jgi:hypothetical protein
MPSRLVLLRVKLYICLLSSLSSAHFPIVFCTKVFRAFFFFRLPRVCIPPRPSGFIYATSALNYGASSYVMSRVVPCFILLMSVFWALFTRSQFVFLRISCQVSSQYCWNSFYISWCLLSYKAAIMITVCKQRGCIITVVTDSRLFCALFSSRTLGMFITSLLPAATGCRLIRLHISIRRATRVRELCGLRMNGCSTYVSVCAIKLWYEQT